MPDASAVAGVVLAIPGIIDLSIKYGQFLAQLIHDVRNSKTEQYERARNLKKQIDDIGVEFKLLQRKSKAFQAYFEYEAEQLYLHLDNIHLRTAVLGSTSPAVWAFLRKRDFDVFIDKLETFHNRFTMKFMLFTFGAMDVGPDAMDLSSPSSRLVNDLRQSIRDRKEGPRSGAASLKKDFSKLPSTTNAISGTELGFLPTKQDGFMIIEERDFSTDAELSESRGRVLDVANLLCTKSPEDKALLAGMGIPHCIGFASQPLDPLQPNQLARLRLIYHTPYETPRLRSLRRILLKDPGFALNDRVHLAHTLAKAVYFTHISQYVHKDIRPGNILVCDPNTSAEHTRWPHALGSAFLVGFSDARRSAAASHVVGTKATERDLYQHPERLEGKPIKHSFMHDVFSLGVCLLEIGLWQSVVIESPQVPELWTANPKWKFLSKEAVERRSGYLEWAKRKVPRIMGRRYAEVVVSCLTDWVADDMIHVSGDVSADVAMGVWYVEQILAKFESINL
ncbi:unnamed protein product [Alternaria alternata]